jgi:N-methylhydantoinase A
MSSYLTGLAETLAALGIGCPVEVMESGGGVLSAAIAAERPVATLESGGAAGVMAAAYVGRLTGASALLSFDMGGTTAKAGIVRDGRPAITHDFQVGGSGSYGHRRAGTGFPLKVPTVDLAEVGAGGGSVAWLDGAGALNVGPRSAGAVPGPACYWRGGTDPTVTDANLVLGYLAPEIAGGVRLDADAATRALVSAVARPLGLDVVAAAWAVHEIVNATMAAAIRVVTVQRGVDPREFTMVGFGGAGPMHVARLADTFGIARVVVPRAAGVAAAVGLVASDPSVVHVRTRVVAAAAARTQPTLVEDLLQTLELRGRADLGAETRVEVARTIDVRFAGQAHQLPVDVPDGPVGGDAIAEITRRFRDAYRLAYGIDLDLPAELVTFRVRVTRPGSGVVPAPLAAGPGGVAEPVGTRDAYLVDRSGLASVAVHDWTTLQHGHTLAGPALIDGPDTTIVVPSGWSALVDPWSNVVLERTADREAT